MDAHESLEQAFADCRAAIKNWHKEQKKHPVDIRQMAWNLTMISFIVHQKTSDRLIDKDKFYVVYEDLLVHIQDLTNYINNLHILIKSTRLYDNLICTKNICKGIEKHIISTDFQDMFISKNFRQVAAELMDTCRNLFNCINKYIEEYKEKRE
jgi:hypothetical protein